MQTGNHALGHAEDLIDLAGAAGTSRLEDLARRLAERHTVVQGPGRRPSLLERLAAEAAQLQAAYEYFGSTAEEQLTRTYAAEWLLDNFYLVQQALRLIREDLPEGYYRQLPKLSATPLAGYARVFALAAALIGQSDEHLDLDKARQFVRAYQFAAPLTTGEIWALPTMLRLVMIVCLRQAIDRVRGLPPAEGDALAAAVAPEHESADDALVASCIRGLRTLAIEDWKAFFESVSRVEAILRHDPAGVYARMDFDTRDRYRSTIEKLALASGQDEADIALAAIDLAQQAQEQRAAALPARQNGAAALGSGMPEIRDPLNPVARAAHVGFYLLDAGRAQLEARVGYHAAWYGRLGRWLLGHPVTVYLGSIALIALAVLLVLVSYAHVAVANAAQAIAAGALILVPAVTVAVTIVNSAITHIVPPRVLPKLDFSDGIPAEHSTIVVVPALLSSADEVTALIHQLELHFFSSADPHIRFALLSDFTDAPREQMPGDDALLADAIAGIQALNQKYGTADDGPFYLFHRERRWNPREGCWMGWERKRGKLEEFSSLLGGSTTTSYVRQVGNLKALSSIAYVLTLDADTLLPGESARILIGTLAHPLNRAELDTNRGRVVAGYTVLQPRIAVKPVSANQSRFTRIFSGATGVDLYAQAVSDVYQDFFGAGIYVGKGIYDIAPFGGSVAGRVPDNTLLSHDLFEGIHGRAGLVTDVVLFEEYPPTYLAYARRLHRWVRGDWQLLPWLLRRVPDPRGGTMPNDLSILDRWKILDNLRRSLFAPALLALLAAGWLWLPGSALVWTLIVLGLSSAPFIAGMTSQMRRGARGALPSGIPTPARSATLHWLLSLMFLPYEALLLLHAIGAVLIRLTITHRHLLQWTTSASTQRLLGSKPQRVLCWRQMCAAPLLALGLAALIGLISPTALPAAAPLLLAWLVFPGVAYWISRPLAHAPAPLPDAQRQQLRALAIRTWLFFEQFVGPEDHWLPPDHFQEAPRGLAAHRTSPTNIGLLLLSTLAAYDFGYIGLLELSARLHNTLDTVEALKTYRGHLLNWYDTHTLNPLPPQYVSTVDSGNLAACLLVLRHGCLEQIRAPTRRWNRWRGLVDALAVLSQVIDDLRGAGLRAAAAPLRAYVDRVRQQILAMQTDVSGWMPLVAHLADTGWQEFDQHLIALVDTPGLDVATLENLRLWSNQSRHHLRSARFELESLLPWLLPLYQPPALFTQSNIDTAIADAWQALVAALPLDPLLGDVPEICEAGQLRLARLRAALAEQAIPTDQSAEAITWCERLCDRLRTAQTDAEQLVARYHSLSARADALFQQMDFSFLFDPQRQVFHIGYVVDTATLDSNYYDLLASESRIASLIAIAKGDVPQRHWLHLGRPFTQANGARVLLSWSGTMFEYLMPILLMRNDDQTLLGQSCRAAVDVQIAYGKLHGVPWGTSESGYYHFDAGQSYQYQAFGVPRLGFKRGLALDLVIAPYASLLALPLRPQVVLRNIDDLSELEMLGRYGLYEAIDFTATRVPPRQRHAIVRSYMAHHQGMILLSLVNYLQDAPMIRRLHADPRIQSAELLLDEQAPRYVPLEQPPAEQIGAARPEKPIVAFEPWRVPVDAPAPHAHALSNGHYTVLLTSAGGGFSRWHDVDLTRWRADTTLDDWGTWVYVQDRASGDRWSAGYQPTAAAPDSQEVRFSPSQAEWFRRDHGIFLHAAVGVAPDDDVEIRRITVINEANHARQLLLISYAEVVLATPGADQRHQAFNKLFVESEYLAETNALLFRRRPRSAAEQPIYLAHALVVEPGRRASGLHESDRARFVGRGRTTRAPLALDEPHAGFQGATGATLDPIMALGQEITLEPQAQARVAYITLAAPSREQAIDTLRRYQSWHAIDHAFEAAREHTELELHRLGYSSAELERTQRLLSALLYPRPALRASPETLAANRQGQPGLWPYAISGDYPILLARIASQEQAGLIWELLRAHACWRSQGIKIDLVILNERETGYSQELHGQLQLSIARTGGDAWQNVRGGIFLLRADQLGEAGRVLLETAARAILDASRGTLAEQLERLDEHPAPLPALVTAMPGMAPPQLTPPLDRPTGLRFDNGIGGFSEDGREYIIYVAPDQPPPAPWINVIANPRLGFLVSEGGLGYSWAENSGENRLTPWRNDPVADAPAEVLYLRDEETGCSWSPTPLPASAPASYLIRHGAGYSVFEHHSHGLRQRLRVFAAADAPLKIVQLRLENVWDQPRRITATFYAEWVLGATRQETQQYIVPEFHADTQALLARNPYNTEFGERVAFVAASKHPHGVTADRSEFLGRMGGLARPAALDRIGLAGTVESGRDPCAAIQLHLDLAPGQAEEIFFLLGQGADRIEALRLIAHYQDAARVATEWDAVNARWDALLGAVHVHTPDPAIDLLLNRWLLYQALACRVWGRAALYQSSGAFGFRDQLQDVLALLYAAPDLAREHILAAARHQFTAGDVLHWWHPPSGRGIRTRCSDDLLWLPFVTAHYVAITGDETILAEQAPFLAGDPLKPDEEERYDRYEPTAELATLYDHCRRALEHGITAGAHGLPLIGTGDWNDGMSRVGSKGRGESVWLGWFLYATLTQYASICERMADQPQAAQYRQRARALRVALEDAWDGRWYRRAYDDDGVPLGSAQNHECQIDSIAQSWAVLSHAGDPEHAARAMQAMADRLVRDDEQLILLFTPPFDQTPRDPGYIKGYPPGVRENGGQYTHAALWAVWAFAELGWGDRTAALFNLLNPIAHGDTPAKISRYRVEPYVVAADVYSVPPHTGRGGWTWYTGSAAWMYRLGLEAILGLRRAGQQLRIEPCIPRNWPSYELSYHHGETLYRICVENPEGLNTGVRQVTLDGTVLPAGEIPLLNDGQQHVVHVLMGTIQP